MFSLLSEIVSQNQHFFAEVGKGNAKLDFKVQLVYTGIACPGSALSLVARCLIALDQA